MAPRSKAHPRRRALRRRTCGAITPSPSKNDAHDQQHSLMATNTDPASVGVRLAETHWITRQSATRRSVRRRRGDRPRVLLASRGLPIGGGGGVRRRGGASATRARPATYRVRDHQADSAATARARPESSSARARRPATTERSWRPALPEREARRGYVSADCSKNGTIRSRRNGVHVARRSVTAPVTTSVADEP